MQEKFEDVQVVVGSYKSKVKHWSSEFEYRSGEV
jgi:hypothetical protein